MRIRLNKQCQRARLMFSMAVVSALASPCTALAERPSVGVAAAQAQTPPWNSVANLEDGRTFVTDGNIVLDTAFAKPANLPTDTVPTAWLESFLATPQPEELRFQDLTLRGRGGADVYFSPRGMLLNPTYVDYLRRVFGNQLRLRCSGLLDPVQIVVNGATVGALMPMEP